MNRSNARQSCSSSGDPTFMGWSAGRASARNAVTNAPPRPRAIVLVRTQFAPGIQL
jgi:hypothetical protein